MPSQATARSVVNRFLGLGLSTGRRSMNLGLRAAGQAITGDKKQAKGRHGFAPVTDRYATAQSQAGVKPARESAALSGKKGAIQKVNKVSTPMKQKKGDAFSAAKQRSSEGKVNTSHLGKVMAARREHEGHREALERLGTSPAGLGKKQMKGVSEGVGKVKTIGQRSNRALNEAQADYQMKLHNKSWGGITEFMKSKKPKLGSGKRFAKIEGKAAKEYGSEEAGKRVAASIMWKKYGKKKGAKLAHHKKSFMGIVEFMKAIAEEGIGGFIKSYRKTKALKGGRRRLTARVTSKTYRQSAPAAKRSTKAKMRAPKRNATKPAGSGIKKSRKDAVNRKGQTDYNPYTEYDRGLLMHERNYDEGVDDSEEMDFPPFEPERARGYYARKRKPGRRTPGAGTDTF